MEFAYYPGCSLESSAREYDESVRETLERLGITLQEIPDWSCCGTTSAHATNRELALTLPARNISLAESMGMDIITPCAGCFSALKKTRAALVSDRQMKKKVEENIRTRLSMSVAIRHVLEVLYHEVTPGEIEKHVERPLEGLRVVNYYGCYLVRPPEIMEFDDPENPVMLDEIMRSLGVEVIDWSSKVDCCGGTLAVTHPEIAQKLVKRIIQGAQEVGAEAIVTACPLCQSNLDARQDDSVNGEGIPIVYFSELTALAYGSNRVKKWWQRHLIDPDTALIKEEASLGPRDGMELSCKQGVISGGKKHDS
jgi:heterodisulfide reductase subunit B